jgi:hypothetical protein
MNDVIRGPRSWLASGLCAAGVAASLFALSNLIQPGRWLGAGALAVVALAAVIAATRSTTRAWWTPTLVGLLAAVVGLLVAYAAPPGRVQLIPDRESVARLGDLLRAGLQAADSSRPPADATVPLEVLVVSGALLVMLAVDLIALGLSAPAWSGLALLALWIPPLIIGRTAGTPAFLDGFAGISAEAVHWMADREVKIFGVETISPDLVYLTDRYPSHKACAQRGITHYENLNNLKDVVNRRIEFFGFPLRLVPAAGSPVRAVGIVDD